MATGYTLSGNNRQAKIEDLGGGKTRVTNVDTGRANVYDTSEVAAKLGQLGAANQTAKITMTNDSGESKMVSGAAFAMNTKAGQEALSNQGLTKVQTADGRDNWVPTGSVPGSGGSSSSGSSGSGEDPMAKALAEANARAAKAEADRKATIAVAEKLQADTKKATDAVTAGQTQAAVNAQMNADATQGAAPAAATTADSATASYEKMLKEAATKKPAVTPDETKTVTDAAEAEAKAIETQLKAAELARTQAETANKELMDKRALADMEEAKAQAQYNADQLKFKQQELDAKQARAEAEARKATYDQEQIAKLQMGKLGLVGSGSALATFQSIATNGITRLSEIQADYALGSAKIAMEAKRESDKLVFDLNKISDSWAEKRIQANKEGALAIAELQKNLTLNELQKGKKIKSELDKLKDEKRADEKFYLGLAKERADYAVATEERLRIKGERDKTTAKDSINLLISTGAWAKKTEAERAQFEKDAGLPVGTANLLASQASSKDFQTLVDKQDLKGYFPSEAATSMFSKKVDEYLQKGLDRTDAVNRSFAYLAQNDPNLKAAIAKATAAKSGGGSGSGRLNTKTYTIDLGGGDSTTYEIPESDWIRIQQAKRDEKLTDQQAADEVARIGMRSKDVSPRPVAPKFRPEKSTIYVDGVPTVVISTIDESGNVVSQTPIGSAATAPSEKPGGMFGSKVVPSR